MGEERQSIRPRRLVTADGASDLALDGVVPVTSLVVAVAVGKRGDGTGVVVDGTVRIWDLHVAVN